MKRIYIIMTGILLLIALFIGFVYIKGYDKPYVLGEIIVGLKSSDTKNKMIEFIRAHPELSIKKVPLTTLPYATLSLKPYSEWREKVMTSQNKDSQIRSDILKGEALLRTEYEKLKSDPLLLYSSIVNSFYYNSQLKESSLPKESSFATIILTFKNDITQEERENFLQRYPQLETVKDYREESMAKRPITYLIKVPKRKEQYWINEFIKQDFVKYAEFNGISHISSKFSTRRIKRMFEILIIEKLFGVSLPSW